MASLFLCVTPDPPDLVPHLPNLDAVPSGASTALWRCEALHCGLVDCEPPPHERVE